MTKQEYLNRLEQAREGDISNILQEAKDDESLTIEELQYITDEVSEILDEIKLSKIRTASRYTEEYLTDDELGLTQM